MRGSVKICGVRAPEHAVAASKAGADLLGFNFAPTRRYVTPAAARVVMAAAREGSDTAIFAVGVFVNASVDEMNAVAEEAGLDAIQLSGDEPAGTEARLERPVLRALRPRPGATVDETLANVRQGGFRPPSVFLLDGYLAGHFGGTGVRADWELGAGLARLIPVMLAGGLDSTNVAEAIAMVRPIGVDVSSGVERDGVKDPQLIAEFVRAAKRAFAEMR